MNISIVGTGYVGLVSAACFSEMGNHVFCVDINPEIISSLQSGKIHIFEPGLEALVQNNISGKRLEFTTNIKEALAKAEVVFICVGTPSRDDGSCDLSYVEGVAREIGQSLESYKVIVNKSTVPVGTAELVKNIISKALKERNISIDFDVVSNPEFLKEGAAVNDFMRPDRVIIGTDRPRAKNILKELYSPFGFSRDKLIVMSPKSAEMTKYAANCMLATKISFINEIANICEQVGADVRDVRVGIGSDERIGYHFIYPGVGYGGSCFPKDVRALIHKADDLGIESQLLKSVDAVNNRQKESMAHKIINYFADKGGVAGKTLAIWGLSFKANTDDIREAASLVIIDKLSSLGMKIQAYDPVAGKNAKNILKANRFVKITDKQYDAIKDADALLVVTEWNQFRTPDFELIKASLTNPAIFDGRNLYSPEALEKAGFDYYCVGR